MLSGMNYLLVTVTCLVAVCPAIRVDWNTNTGPIIPPTPRTTVRPVPPFRSPAPVWEDLSNDIPDPNPYIYVLPPPSRPKQRLNTNVNYNGNDSGAKSYGAIVTPANVNNNHFSPQVASLSAHYIPNVGTRYVGVVPTALATKSSPTAANQLSQNASPNAFAPADKSLHKVQGKYNAKTKKYKAYEYAKIKYVPLNYQSPSVQLGESATLPAPPPGHQSPSQFDLPAKDIEPQWAPGFDDSSTTIAPAIPLKPYSSGKFSYRKHIYAKDQTTPKPKGKLSELVDKAGSS